MNQSTENSASTKFKAKICLNITIGSPADPQIRQRYRLEEPVQLHAAKGVVYAEWAVSIKIARLGINDEFVILQNVPTVLSLGKLVVDKGFHFAWEGRDLACLSRGTVRVYCPLENNVPYVGKVGYALMSRKIEGNSVELHPVTRSSPCSGVSGYSFQLLPCRSWQRQFQVYPHEQD